MSAYFFVGNDVIQRSQNLLDVFWLTSNNFYLNGFFVSKSTSDTIVSPTESTHKPWPRNNKKREGPGNTPKNEPYRKNVPAQRGRGQVDRRPRPRGGAVNFSVGGAQDTGLVTNFNMFWDGKGGTSTRY